MKALTKPKTIQEYQGYLRCLYGPANRAREIDYLYGYLCRSTAYLGKNISLGKVEDQHFLRALSWLFAVANYFELEIQHCLFSRFPSICPYCLTSPCICFRTKKTPSAYVPAYKAQEELSDRFSFYFQNATHDLSMTTAIRTLATIYPKNEIIWHHAGPWHLLAKMQEEVGELHEAISKFSSGQKPKSTIGEELADTFAWLLSAWGIVFRSRSFDDAFIDYYYQDCPVCTQFPCRCADRADRAAELIDSRVLESIQSHLEDLQKHLPAASRSLSELRDSVAAAAGNQSEPTTVLALKEAKGTLEKIKVGISTTDEMGQKSLSIINSITQLLGKIPWS